MSCKIKVDKFNKVAGKRVFKLCTTDAKSLEARVVTSDTVLNESGMDPVLTKVYDPNSGYGEDLHSATSFATFGGSINLQINEVTDDKGKDWLFIDKQRLEVMRNGQKQIVEGSDIQDTDEILNYI